MRNRLLIISILLSNSFFCSYYSVMAADLSIQDRRYPLTKANLEALFLPLEECGDEKAKYYDREGNFLIDYSRMRVCDMNTTAAPHYSKVVGEIQQLLETFKPSQPIVMNFEGNYLEDEGVRALVDFIIGNPLLKNQLKKIDLSNNRFKTGCLPNLKNLIEQCPRLEKLDIAINYISDSEVDQAFQGLTGPKKAVVYFAPY